MKSMFSLLRKTWIIPGIVVSSLLLSSCGGGGTAGTTTATSDTTSTSDTTRQIASTGEIQLSWQAPSSRTDGGDLDLYEIDEYRLYYGTRSGEYAASVSIDGGAETSVTISDLPVGTYYLVLTAVDINGLESAPSNEAVKVVS